MSKEKVEAQLYQDVFTNVMALYSALKAVPSKGVRRTELRQGEVTAEAVDFIADVEIKAKRTLGPTYFNVLLNLAAEEKYQLFRMDLQWYLGKVFLANDLNFDGAYRVLYYKAKNSRLHDREEPTHFPEEPEDVLQ